MNAIVAIDIPTTATFDDWIEVGRELAQSRRHVDWLIGDWLATGRERFPNQVQFDFLADALGLAPKRLKAAAEVASHFPASQRDEALSVEHHANVQTLPADEALSILKQARAQHWTPEETRIAAVRRRVEIGQHTLIPDDDWEYRELMEIVRKWNRARPDARQSFMQLASEAALGVIDA